MDLKLKSNIHTEIISKLLHSRTQAHVFHWRTRSYSVHKALDEYYTDIVDLIDTYVETIQGKLGEILTGYKSYPIIEDDNSIKFFTQLKTDVEFYRLNTLNRKEFNNLDNQCQVIVDLIEQTLYKLKFLA